MRLMRRRREAPVYDPSWVENALVDAAVDAYAAWREVSLSARRAYRRWSEAADGDRSAAFAAYAYALDHEQRAADFYAAVIARYLSVRA